MKLLDFKGLNCYSNCLVNIAAFLGVDYLASFANLWSETDFVYESMHNIYVTKRMIKNFELLGAKVEIIDCSSTIDAKRALSLFQKEEWIILGIDFFYMNWHPYYQTFHGYHYVSCRKEHTDVFTCFDPIYDKHHMEMMGKDIISHVFDIRRIVKINESPFDIEVLGEAQKIIKNHPQTQEKFIDELTGCIRKNHENIALLAKYIDAMINNRYLYQHYIHNHPLTLNKYQEFFDNEYFMKWIGVKNGLYKASLIFDNEKLINEVCQILPNIMKEEIDMANKMIN